MSANCDFDASAIGVDLVEYSREDYTSARGIVTDLFPYIAVAARRMSARSISRYLQDRHGVKLSAVTIAKALREPAKHIEPFAERVESAARIVADAHDVTIGALLMGPDAFFGITMHPPKLAVASNEEAPNAYDEYRGARDFIANTWLQLDPAVRGMTLEYVATDDGPDAAEPKAEDE
jgi:hypothetical protein